MLCTSKVLKTIPCVFFLLLFATVLGKPGDAFAQVKAIVPGGLQGAENRNEQAASRLKIGDKVNIVVYERVDRAEDKWGSSTQRSPDVRLSFVQRAELSGERIIQDDENIAIPFLGQVRAATLTTTELEGAVAKAFEQVFHRAAFATVIGVEHNPIFIVGPVKNQGTYKYSPNMTILHAIALAGGTEQLRLESWQTFEAMREEVKLRRARTTAAKMLARAANLRAERSGAAVVVPDQLLQLVGPAEAKAFIEDERALRSLALSARRARETELRSLMSSAETELQAANARITPLATGIDLRRERFNAISSLQANGMQTKGQLADAHTALSDLEGRRLDALSAATAAKRKFDLAKEELARFELEYQAQLALDVANADRDVSENLDIISGSEGSIKAISANAASQGTAPRGPAYTYEIIRRSANGTQIIPANETTPLEPGDLVRLKASESPAEQRSSISAGQGKMPPGS